LEHGRGTEKRRKGMRNPPRRRRFNYAGDAAGLIEGERTAAKKTRQRDRTRRNRNAPGNRRIGCRISAGDYRNGGADAGSGRRVMEKTCLRCKMLGIDALAPRTSDFLTPMAFP
jgi:hypothetical protein